MKALAGIAACAALAAFAVGCDDHDSRETPLVDTTTVTGADLAARDAGAASLNAAAVPPLPAAITDVPVMRVTPANGAYVAPSMQVTPPSMAAGQVSAPVATAPVATAPANGVTGNSAADAPGAPGTGGARNFTGSSFGPAPSSGYVVPDSPPSDNHGNGTLGSSTGSHDFDRGANP